MEHRYSALRFIGTIYKILGIIVLILAILGGLGACASALIGGAAFSDTARNANLPILGGVVGGIIAAVISILWGGVVGLGLYAAGDFISLLLAVEENTRASAMLLRGQPPAAISGGASPAATTTTPIAPR